MRTTTLYKRNAKNKIVVWSITDNDNNTLSISHGILSCKKIHDVINTTRIKTDEYKSRINAKRKEGYKDMVKSFYDLPGICRSHDRCSRRQKTRSGIYR